MLRQSLVGTLTWGENTCQAELIDRPTFAILNDETAQDGFWMPLVFATEPLNFTGGTYDFTFTHDKTNYQEATTTSWFGGKSTACATFTTNEVITFRGKLIAQETIKGKNLLVFWANEVQYKHS